MGNALIELNRRYHNEERRNAAPRMRLVRAFPPRRRHAALLHRKDCLQGSEIAAVISSRRLVPAAGSSSARAGSGGLELPLRSSHKTQSQGGAADKAAVAGVAGEGAADEGGWRCVAGSADEGAGRCFAGFADEGAADAGGGDASLG